MPAVRGCGRGPRTAWAGGWVPGARWVGIVWRQRVWRCVDVGCATGRFVEQVADLVAPRGSITTRAVSWAIGQLRREHATIAGLARQPGTSWKTMWCAVEPGLVRLAADESLLENVTALGVEEHVWRHVDSREEGPSLSSCLCKWSGFRWFGGIVRGSGGRAR